MHTAVVEKWFIKKLCSTKFDWKCQYKLERDFFFFKCISLRGIETITMLEARAQSELRLFLNVLFCRNMADSMFGTGNV